MSILMGLFGRSKDRKHAATDRCMDCGMVEGKHTTWCPAASKADAPAAPAPAAVDTAAKVEGDASPT